MTLPCPEHGPTKRPIAGQPRRHWLGAISADGVRARRVFGAEKLRLLSNYKLHSGLLMRLREPSLVFGARAPKGVYLRLKTPMAPLRAPLAEQTERRISDPLYGAGGGFPLRE